MHKTEPKIKIKQPSPWMKKGNGAFQLAWTHHMKGAISIAWTQLAKINPLCHHCLLTRCYWQYHMLSLPSISYLI